MNKRYRVRKENGLFHDFEACNDRIANIYANYYFACTNFILVEL